MNVKVFLSLHIPLLTKHLVGSLAKCFFILTYQTIFDSISQEPYIVSRKILEYWIWKLKLLFISVKRAAGNFVWNFTQGTWGTFNHVSNFQVEWHAVPDFALTICRTMEQTTKHHIQVLVIFSCSKSRFVYPSTQCYDISCFSFYCRMASSDKLQCKTFKYLQENLLA